jgi:heterodisulfide reductase subunit C
VSSVPDERQPAEEEIIDLRGLEPGFRDEIVREPGGEGFMRCFSCGTCTASCPVSAITARYNPRRIVRMAMLGMRERVLTSQFVWLCAACYTCYERCPQDVHIPDLMTCMRNIAVREGYVPATYRLQAELLRDHGRLYEITGFENERRAETGLPPVREEAGEVRRILVKRGVVSAERVTPESVTPESET